MYNECPKRYYYTYIEKIEIDQPQSIRDDGIIIHDILSTIVETEDLNESIKLTIKNLGKQYPYDDIVENGETVREWLLKADRFPYGVIGSELWINYEIGKYHIAGRIDRLDKISDEVYRIVDYKAGNFEYKTVEKSLQFDMYSAGIFSMYPEVSDLEIVYENILYGTSAVGTVSRTELSNLLERIKTYLDVIEQDEEYNERVDYHCATCEFKGICPAFKNWLKIDGKVVDDELELGRIFLEYRTKAKYYNEGLETIKDILKMKIGIGQIVVDEKSTINISDGGIYVRNKR